MADQLNRAAQAVNIGLPGGTLPVDLRRWRRAAHKPLPLVPSGAVAEASSAR